MEVAIEGGGTKTRGWLVDGDAVVARADEGPSNVQALGPARAAELVTRLVDALVTRAGVPRTRVEAIGLGMAGAGTRADRERLAAALKDAGAGFPAAIVSDARACLEGATGGEGGVVLIAGTGSIALAATPSGAEARAGGWGSALGDEGSGYALGRALLAAVTRELDGRAERALALELARHLGGEAPSALELARHPGGEAPSALELARHPGGEAPSGLEPWIREHARDTAAIAQLAPLVTRLSAGGDARARRILEDGARELALMARAAHAGAGLAEDARVVLHGGLLAGDAHYRALVTSALAACLPRARTGVAHADDALRGCVLIARRALTQPAEERR